MNYDLVMKWMSPVKDNIIYKISISTVMICLIIIIILFGLYNAIKEDSKEMTMGIFIVCGIFVAIVGLNWYYLTTNNDTNDPYISYIETHKVEINNIKDLDTSIIRWADKDLTFEYLKIRIEQGNNEDIALKSIENTPMLKDKIGLLENYIKEHNK